MPSSKVAAERLTELSKIKFSVDLLSASIQLEGLKDYSNLYSNVLISSDQSTTQVTF